VVEGILNLPVNAGDIDSVLIGPFRRIAVDSLAGRELNRVLNSISDRLFTLCKSRLISRGFVPDRSPGVRLLCFLLPEIIAFFPLARLMSGIHHIMLLILPIFTIAIRMAIRKCSHNLRGFGWWIILVGSLMIGLHMAGIDILDMHWGWNGVIAKATGITGGRQLSFG
jgi:hypothetical protein